MAAVTSVDTRTRSGLPRGFRNWWGLEYWELYATNREGRFHGELN